MTFIFKLIILLIMAFEETVRFSPLLEKVRKETVLANL